MNVALASLDKRTRHNESDVYHSNEYCYVDDGRHHVWQTMQMAEHALVYETLLGSEVTVVVNVMRTIVAIGRSGTALRLRVVVEGNGKHHWQIHQHQQPRKSHSSIVKMTHMCKSNTIFRYHQQDEKK